jgi:predicted secreted Zn-dependent protease
LTPLTFTPLRLGNRPLTWENETVNPPITWQRSSKCSGGHCVEVAREGTLYLVRDSNTPDEGMLVFTAESWHAFTAGIKAGEFE